MKAARSGSRRSIRSRPPRQRTAIVLRYVGDFTHAVADHFKGRVDRYGDVLAPLYLNRN